MMISTETMTALRTAAAALMAAGKSCAAAHSAIVNMRDNAFCAERRVLVTDSEGTPIREAVMQIWRIGTEGYARLVVATDVASLAEIATAEALSSSGLGFGNAAIDELVAAGELRDAEGLVWAPGS